MQETLEARGVSKEIQKQLGRYGGDFAHWRFGTIKEVTSEHLRLEVSFILGFFSKQYDLKDGSELEVVGKFAFSDCTYGGDTSLLDVVVGFVVEFDGWGRGCICHPDECRKAHEQGLVFKCPEDRKGRNLPFFWDELQARHLR